VNALKFPEKTTGRFFPITKRVLIPVHDHAFNGQSTRKEGQTDKGSSTEAPSASIGDEHSPARSQRLGEMSRNQLLGNHQLVRSESLDESLRLLVELRTRRPSCN
jgi:hypothetical protein